MSAPVPTQISDNLMTNEEILYSFEYPHAFMRPGIVFTNMRLIHYEPKMFGIELKDFSWRDLDNVIMKEGLFSGNIKFMIGEYVIFFERISNDDVREMYKLAKDLKEKAHLRSKTTIINSNQEDPVAKLKQLKEMRDGELISQEEYDMAKATILAKMQTM